ncbi:sentrin-specific protease 8 [Leptidea sinapis]|uniref:sentrin-specific protease 8 n=1 Tax=Leptidea sinapis TaxID=189913 RepID=UPI00211F8329|nr:sentrin-specific protease 8 [Leptidea sinapis]XP_050666215.1 sentrin-specific protease 8 [Leptidea sinapis]XP_050666216.1 sentrin-specific protease 8 [Leptidea sinapis]
MSKASVVLSFHETLLHQSDIELLNGPYWLNDTIISFYFEYLEKVTFIKSQDILFVPPEVTQCIKMVTPDEIKIFLEPLKIEAKKFVFFALNDNSAPDMVGGSHWSLLVYSRDENSFFHYDSMCGSNHNVAWSFSSHLMSYFSKAGLIHFSDKECIQQSNGYDCGVHVLCNTKTLAEHATRNGEIASCDMTIKINPCAKRKEILALIHNLANSG